MQDTINILVSFDKNYLRPYKTLFKSLVFNNPGEKFHVRVLHNKLNQEIIEELHVYTALFGDHEISFIDVEDSFFDNSQTTKQYPKEMYFRMLAPKLLPESLERIIYLDPDILVINSIRPLWELDIEGNPFAAASHTAFTEIKNSVNRVRLKMDSDYFNTGIIVMDLVKAREVVDSDEIHEFTENYKFPLILPDQDIFNHLFGSITYQLNDAYYNFDPRYLSRYTIASNGLVTMDWVMQNTVIIHYCGKTKPWNKLRGNSFDVLYKHYMFNEVDKAR